MSKLKIPRKLQLAAMWRVDIAKHGVIQRETLRAIIESRYNIDTIRREL
jgi:hypothetical protein